MSCADVSVRWCPGHTGIQGNEEADALADAEAQNPQAPTGQAGHPTLSGIRSIAKRKLRSIRLEWWTTKGRKLSQWYRDWGLGYDTHKAPKELSLPRNVLQRLIALRTTHGDFAWYHRKFRHDDAKLDCACGMAKSPAHLVHCSRTQRLFAQWPARPRWPPCDRKEGLEYLDQLLKSPDDFAAFLELTEFYSKICTR